MIFPKFSVYTSVILGLAALTMSYSATAEDPIRLNFGVYSSNKPSAMVRIFKPALQELENRMSSKLQRTVDIRMQIAKDYDQGISHLTTGKVDFSRFGPSSYIEAKRMNNDIQIAGVESKNSAKVFYGIIAVKKSSTITDIKQLKGRSFAFGDEGSTIGRFLSQLYLEQNGIRAHDLSDYEYLGRHDKVGTAVGAGDFDAGALNEATFRKLVDAGENIRELARFPNVTKPWIARSGLDPEVFQALKESLLEITNPTALKGMKVDGFLAGNDEDYRVIKTAMENNYVFFSDPVETEASPRIEPVAAIVEPAEVTEQDYPVTSKPVVVQTSEGRSASIKSSGNSITINI